MKKILFAWSSGKDSAMALYKLMQSRDYDIISMITTVTEGYNRVSMHGSPIILLEEQAKSIGLPLEKIVISKQSSNEEYESKMKEVLEKYLPQGLEGVAFGDIFLEDVREYRENNLKKVNLKGIYPIWGENSVDLAHKFINNGFKAIITCVDTEQLDASFCGRLYDRNFLNDLPEGVDPCGENGEFHSFAFEGPIFKAPVKFSKGEIVLRDNRYKYCDLIPEGQKATVS